MNTLRTDSIVVGVDESALAGQAVRWAAEQAALEGRSLRLVRAVHPVPAGRSEHAAVVQPGTFTSLRLHSEALLTQAHELAHRVAPDVEIEEQLEVTSAHTLLLDVAETAHLVVLGSRGRGPVLSHLLGSVGLGVVRHATCPVVVHRPGHPGRVHDGVLVAVDATADSVEVLEFAFRQASLRRLRSASCTTPSTHAGPARRAGGRRTPRCRRVGRPGPVGGDGGTGWRPRRPLLRPDRAGRARAGRHPGSEPCGPPGRRHPPARRTGRLVGGLVSIAILEHAKCPVAVVPVQTS